MKILLIGICLLSTSVGFAGNRFKLRRTVSICEQYLAPGPNGKTDKLDNLEKNLDENDRASSTQFTVLFDDQYTPTLKEIEKASKLSSEDKFGSRWNIVSVGGLDNHNRRIVTMRGEILEQYLPYLPEPLSVKSREVFDDRDYLASNVLPGKEIDKNDEQQVFQKYLAEGNRDGETYFRYHDGRAPTKILKNLYEQTTNWHFKLTLLWTDPKIVEDAKAAEVQIIQDQIEIDTKRDVYHGDESRMASRLKDWAKTIVLDSNLEKVKAANTLLTRLAEKYSGPWTRHMALEARRVLEPKLGIVESAAKIDIFKTSPIWQGIIVNRDQKRYHEMSVAMVALNSDGSETGLRSYGEISIKDIIEFCNESAKDHPQAITHYLAWELKSFRYNGEIKFKNLTDSAQKMLLIYARNQVQKALKFLQHNPNQSVLSFVENYELELLGLHGDALDYHALTEIRRLSLTHEEYRHESTYEGPLDSCCEAHFAIRHYEERKELGSKLD